MGRLGKLQRITVRLRELGDLGRVLQNRTRARWNFTSPKKLRLQKMFAFFWRLF